MTRIPTIDQARHVIGGLVYGDGHSYAALWNRITLLPDEKLTFYRSALGLMIDAAHTTQTHPHRHGWPADTWQVSGPTDATEWAVVSALHLVGASLGGAEDSGNAWSDLALRRAADPDSVRARIGTAHALANIASGQSAPATGNDNPHYFDDQACVRAIMAGIAFAGEPGAAADAAADDAQHTHSLDGVWCARATAALVAAGLGGDDRHRSIDIAVDELPHDSWSANTVADCRTRALMSEGQADLADLLETETLDDIYSYSVSAPETLGALLAHLTVATSAAELLAGVHAHPRVNGTLMPLAGAVAAVFFGGAWLPSSLRQQLPRLDGTSIRDLRGYPLETVASALTAGH